MVDDVIRQLEGSHLLISCEGTAEYVIVDKLVAADALRVPKENIIEVTRKRKASDIQQDYLGFDYDWPVTILRVLDSRKESFKLGRLYTDRFPVVNIYTHPEIEVLVVIREGEWSRWKRAGCKPSDYCKQELHMRDIKSARFLEEYWDADSIINACNEYRRISSIAKGEHCLADLIK